MTAFSIFGLDVYAYGLAVAVSAAVSLAFAAACMRKAKLNTDALSWFALLATPLCVLGARVAYCLACWNWFVQDVGFFFRLTEGGYMLYGALLGGFAAAVIAAKATRQNTLRVADALAAPALLMIALCRAAEGLAGQGYGEQVDTWFDADMGMCLFHPENTEAFHFFPLAVQETYYEQWVFAVFVLEALLMLALCVIVAKASCRRAGWKTLLMVLLYACTQVLCEGLRRDDVLRWGFVRINQIVGGIIAAACMLVFCLARKNKQGAAKEMALSWLGLFAGAGLVLACEFAVEKKIVPLEWVPTDVVYVFMALACMLMMTVLYRQWCASDEETAS